MRKVLSVIFGVIPSAVGLFLFVPNALALYSYILSSETSFSTEASGILVELLQAGAIICFSLLVLALIIALRSDVTADEIRLANPRKDLDIE